ncbi:MAG: hypothetical protein HYY20_09250, partial [Candidatus Tectomicrobia bacterium]|nr:hypothetical protein [Candidatus Tectomicrobia bacterium]
MFALLPSLVTLMAVGLAPRKAMDHKADFVITADAVTPVVAPPPLLPDLVALPIPVSELVEGDPPAFITDSGRLSGLVRF